MSVPKYLILCPSNVFRGKTGCLPNIKKNRDSLECSLGIKLYAAQARGIRTSHSNCGTTCLATHALRKAWNPAILPLKLGGMVEYEACTPSKFLGYLFKHLVFEFCAIITQQF